MASLARKVMAMAFAVAFLVMVLNIQPIHSSTSTNPDQVTASSVLVNQPSAISANFNVMNSNPSEKNWLGNAYHYAYEKYGRNASSSELDHLQYLSLIDFFNWYQKDYKQLPADQRNLTQKNLSALFKTYSSGNTHAQKILNEITNSEVTNYEHALTAETSNLTLHGQGILVSNVSIAYNNSVAYILSYSYHFNFTTIRYSMMFFDGKKTLLDPSVMENAFTLYAWFVPYGTSYNTNLKFTSAYDAFNYENFLISETNSYGVTVGVLVGLAFVFAIAYIGAVYAGTTLAAWLGTAAGVAISGVISTIIGAILGVITGSTLANNVQTLFNDQWWSYGYFWVVYTVNIYLYIANTMSIWGPVGSGTYQVFNSYVPLPDFFNTDIYIYYWSQFANTHGQNTWVGEAAPSWTDWLEYWP